jgi:histidinol-phosphate/aromatic aminotransferase/cobyric acid decarboxylase-like protein
MRPGNFLFARHPAHDGAALHKALRSRNILVRHVA